MESVSLHEQYRFPVTPESMQIMQKAKLAISELTNSHPYLSGIGFFGSRTKGREKPESDLDVIIFYDSSKIDASRNKDEELLEIKNNLSETLGVELGSHVGWEKDISLIKTDIDIYNYINFSSSLSSMSREDAVKIIEKMPEAQNLFSRFFLATGEGV
jgi:predicted nucleotidyltransferase